MDYLEREMGRSRRPYYKDNFREMNAIDSDSPNSVNIVNDNIHEPNNTAVQYNKIDIHIHLPESYNKETVDAVLKQVGDNLGAVPNGKIDSQKSKIFNFWNNRK